MNDADLILDDEDELTAEEAEFSGVNVRRLCHTGSGGDLQLSERRDRINRAVRLQDIIAELHDGETRDLFSCPFHGTDSRPSFKVYPEKNNAFCFGCPGDGFYDSVKFVAAKLEFSALRAIHWIEKRYKLPPLDVIGGEEEEDLDEEPSDHRVVTLTFDDLVDPYIALTAAAFAQNPNIWTVRGHMQRLYDAVPDEAPDSPASLLKALPLAKVLGMRRLEAIKTQRFGEHA